MLGFTSCHTDCCRAHFLQRVEELEVEGVAKEVLAVATEFLGCSPRARL
jgi:hypothetical protein